MKRIEMSKTLDGELSLIYAMSRKCRLPSRCPVIKESLQSLRLCMIYSLAHKMKHMFVCSDKRDIFKSTLNFAPLVSLKFRYVLSILSKCLMKQPYDEHFGYLLICGKFCKF